MYTNFFNATSAAAAIVAGAALSIQGMVEKAQGRRFSPWELRAILRDPAMGTPVSGLGTNRGIPDLRLIADQAIGVAPDVYVRDYVGDVGDPDGISRAMSPDIIVSATALGNPQGNYGAGSGTEDVEGLGDQVQSGQNNFVYVRVRNRGGSDAADVKVTVYWSEPSTLITPDAWHELGTATIASVPRGDVLTVSPSITWAAADIPASGHYCLVAIAGNAADVAPQPFTVNTPQPPGWDEFVKFVSVNNNVAWRNFDVISVNPLADEEVELEFLMRGAPDQARPMSIELMTQLPDSATAAVEVPAQVLDLWGRRSPFVTVREGRARIPVTASGRTTFPTLPVPAKARVPVKVVVRIPAGALRVAHNVFVRQLHEGTEVGRVTWRLAARRER